MTTRNFQRKLLVSLIFLCVFAIKSPQRAQGQLPPAMSEPLDAADGARVLAMAAAPGGVFPDDIKEDAAALGKKLVESCKTKAKFPEVEAAHSEFQERMRMLVTFRKDDWPYEYEYWQEHYGME